MIYSGWTFIDAIEHDRIIIECDGIEFPLGTPLVEWLAHGVATFKPFTGCEGLDKVRVQRPYVRINIFITLRGWQLGTIHGPSGQCNSDV